MNAVRILLSLIYPIIFIIPITLSSLCYLQKKHREALISGLLFFVYIVDHLVIMLTELVPSFAALYDKTFLVVPTWKTMIYVVSFACMIYLFEYIMRTGKVFAKCLFLFICTFFQMFVPMMPDGPLKVWIYYLPPQLFMFVFAISGLFFIKKYKSLNTDDIFLKTTHQILIITAIFSIVILLEDSYVIFNVDNYTSPVTYIYNRNNCEDIFRVICAVLSSKIMMYILKDDSIITSGLNADASDNQDSSELPNEFEDPDTHLLPSSDLNSEEISSEADSDTPKPNLDEAYVKLILFSEQYQLTERERHILNLLLSGMSNQDISEELTISLGTVKTHTHNIFSKLDVSRRSEAKRLYEGFVVNK